jgi:hypothetical protein
MKKEKSKTENGADAGASAVSGVLEIIRTTMNLACHALEHSLKSRFIFLQKVFWVIPITANRKPLIRRLVAAEQNIVAILFVMVANLTIYIKILK